MPNETITNNDFEIKDWIDFYKIFVEEANHHHGQALYTQALSNAYALSENFIEGKESPTEIKWFILRKSTLLSVLPTQLSSQQKIKFAVTLNDITTGGALFKTKIKGSHLLRELNSCNHKRSAPQDPIHDKFKNMAKEEVVVELESISNPLLKKRRTESFMKTGDEYRSLYALQKKNSNSDQHRDKDMVQLGKFNTVIDDIKSTDVNNLNSFLEKTFKLLSELNQFSFYSDDFKVDASNSFVSLINTCLENLDAKAKALAKEKPLEAIKYLEAQISLLEKIKKEVPEYKYLPSYFVRCYSQLISYQS